MISVIVPCYNSSKYLRYTLDSILEQSYEDYELICIDDKSTDDTLKILKEYCDNDNRVVLLENEENKGIAYSRNKGIDAATGEYICFIDHDDILPVDSLKKRYDFMKKHPGIGCVAGGSVQFSDGEESNLPQGIVGKRRSAKYMRSANLFNCCFMNGTTLVRMRVIKDNGVRFRELLGVEDYRFYAELLLVTDCFAIEDTLLYHRVMESQYTQVCMRDEEKYKKRQEHIDDIHSLLIDGYGINFTVDEKEMYLRLFREDNGYGTFSQEEIKLLKKAMSKLRKQILLNSRLSVPVAYRQTIEKQYKACKSIAQE